MSASRPLLIGVTGNIGSGKSSFCAFLESSGIKVLYADRIAKEVLNQAETLTALQQRWGSDVAPDGKASHPEIARRVFGNPEELAFLNSLVHPGTLKLMQAEVEISSQPVLVFEVPLLFEAGLEGCFDYLVLVTAPEDLRKERLFIRDGLLSEDARKRVRSQMPDDAKAPQCDLVIQNTGSVDDLFERAKSLVDGITSIRRRDIKPFWAE